MHSDMSALWLQPITNKVVNTRKPQQSFTFYNQSKEMKAISNQLKREEAMRLVSSTEPAPKPSRRSKKRVRGRGKGRGRGASTSQSYFNVETKDIEIITNVGRKLIRTVEKNFDLEHDRVSKPREMTVRYG